MRRLAISLVVVATAIVGCLFPALDDLTSGGDASVPDTGAPDVITRDAGVDAAPRCDLAKPFSSPVPIPGAVNTSADEVTPRYTADELTLVFSRYLSTSDAGLDDYDLYIATRPSNDVAFPAATAITELDTPAGEYDPFLFADGLTIYFASDRPDGARQRIYAATRPSLTSPFAAPIDVGALDLAASYVGQPFFVPETTVYFADVDQGGIFTATAQSGTFTSPVLVAGLPDSGPQFPSLTGDALTIYVSGAGAGDDVFVATRPDLASPFGALTPVPELDSSSDDDPSWVSPDGCVIVLMSDRQGDFDMYFAQRGN